MKYVIGIIVLVLVTIAGYFAWTTFSVPALPEEQASPQPIDEAKNTYATSTFTIQYPSTYDVDEAYTYDAFAGKPIAGVKFLVPESLAAETNLSAFDTGVSVEWLPRAQKCTGDIYVLPNVPAIEMTVGSTTYSVATTSEAGAGNRYEEMVYAVKDSKPCTAVRYLLHYSAIENFPQEEGTEQVREFDKASLLRAFDAIRDSLQLSQ